MQANHPVQPNIPEAPERRNALLCRAYEGEIIGCAMYQELIARHSSDHAEPLQLLYDIERLTADALVPLIQHYQVAVSEEAADQEGRRLGAGLVTRPWKSMWNEVIRIADDYLRDFNRLPDVLDEPHAAVGRQVVEHEEALIAFAHLEIADNPEALLPRHDYLHRYRAGVNTTPAPTEGSI